MECHSQDHHGGPLKLAFWAFGLIAAQMEMRNQSVQEQQKQDSQPESGSGGEKRQRSQPGRLFDGGDQQAPDRCRHHDSGGEAGQRPLDLFIQCLPHEKDAGRTEGCTEKRNQNTIKSGHKNLLSTKG